MYSFSMFGITTNHILAPNIWNELLRPLPVPHPSFLISSVAQRNDATHFCSTVTLYFSGHDSLIFFFFERFLEKIVVRKFDEETKTKRKETKQKVYLLLKDEKHSSQGDGRGCCGDQFVDFSLYLLYSDPEPTAGGQK
mmetsp:Transcript_7561/g.9429  ORF Transcript_7561/g.9429 Transcript_7561/m.9429 type:complete len:138 (+) Transcript_7561:358-771(+)